ncbi:MAG: DUF3987 domain-containing protein [Anaerolineae bacterium]|nr:DUF3987 domain-containing protein [Anaerolineae bacterium]
MNRAAEQEEAATGATVAAGETRGSASSSHPYYTTKSPQSTANPQALWHLARLLAGASDADRGLIRTTWPDAPLNGGAPDYEALRAWLKKQPELLDAVLAVDPENEPQMEPVIPSDWDVPELPAAAQLSDAMVDEALQVGGWVGEYLSYAQHRSPRTPDLFHEAAALWLGGLAIARRLMVPMAHGKIYPHLYVLWIAPTTLYAKSTGLHVLTDVLDRAIPHLRLSSEFTPEALQAEMAGKEPVGLAAESPEVQELWRAGRNFAAQRGIVLDEASSLFAGFRRDYMTGAAEMLLRLHDAPTLFRRHTRGAGYTVLKSPALSFLGATTPTGLRQSRIEEGWHNGFFARFALLTPNERPTYARTEGWMDPPATIIDTLRRLAGQMLCVPEYPEPPEEMAIAIDREAYERWEAYDRAATFDMLTGENAPDGRLSGVYARLPTQALKVAMILAALDWADGYMETPRITLAHWARGQMIAEEWRYSAHRLLVLVNDRADDEREERIIRVLRRGGETGLTAREVGQLIRGVNRNNIEPVLENLVTDGIAEKFVPPEKKAVRYRLVNRRP